MFAPPPLTALIISLTAWLGAAFDAAPDPRSSGQQLVVQQMVVRDEIILHVPIAQRRLPRFEWVEHKGPKCLPAATIAGAAMATPSTIDFVLRDRSRVRAWLDNDCAGLDFYGGFYVEPQNGAVCAKREEIRSRAGSTCRIERFRALERKYKH
jgi:hypothetical protein